MYRVTLVRTLYGTKAMQLLFWKEEQGRNRVAEPKELREKDTAARFEELRLELVNYLLQEMGSMVKLEVINDEQIGRIRALLRRRGGQAAQVPFCIMALETALTTKRWSKFTCQDFKEHIQEVKQMVTKLRKK